MRDVCVCVCVCVCVYHNMVPLFVLSASMMGLCFPFRLLPTVGFVPHAGTFGSAAILYALGCLSVCATRFRCSSLR